MKCGKLRPCHLHSAIRERGSFHFLFDRASRSLGGGYFGVRKLQADKPHTLTANRHRIEQDLEHRDRIRRDYFGTIRGFQGVCSLYIGAYIHRSFIDIPTTHTTDTFRGYHHHFERIEVGVKGRFGGSIHRLRCYKTSLQGHFKRHFDRFLVTGSPNAPSHVYRGNFHGRQRGKVHFEDPFERNHHDRLESHPWIFPKSLGNSLDRGIHGKSEHFQGDRPTHQDRLQSTCPTQRDHRLTLGKCIEERGRYVDAYLEVCHGLLESSLEISVRRMDKDTERLKWSLLFLAKYIYSNRLLFHLPTYENAYIETSHH